MLLPIPTLKLLHMLTMFLLQATWAVRALIRTGMAAAFWLCYICLLLIIGYWLCLQLAHPPSTRKRCPLRQSLEFAS